MGFKLPEKLWRKSPASPVQPSTHSCCTSRSITATAAAPPGPSSHSCCNSRSIITTGPAAPPATLLSPMTSSRGPNRAGSSFQLLLQQQQHQQQNVRSLLVHCVGDHVSSIKVVLFLVQASPTHTEQPRSSSSSSRGYFL